MMFGGMDVLRVLHTCIEYHDRKDLTVKINFEVLRSRLSEFIGIEDEAEQ